MVVIEPHLDVFLAHLLTQDDDLLASISRSCVVRHVHDLQLLLGLGIIDRLGAYGGQDHCVLSWSRWILQEYLEAKFDSIQIYGVGIVDVIKSLSEWINSDLLSQLQRLSNVFLPDTLDTQVGELHCHVLVVDVHGADPLLTPISANTGWTDQVVRVSLGRIRIMGPPC